MNFTDLAVVIPEGLADHSRVWIYQSSRPFSDREISEINEQLLQFYTQWKSHGAAVDGWARVFFDRYVVFIADESRVPLGGCSMDDAQRVVKSLERQYQVRLFDRLSISFLVKEKIEVLPMNQVQYALDKGFIQMDTPMFNNLVATKKEFIETWISPLSATWLAGKVMKPATR